MDWLSKDILLLNYENENELWADKDKIISNGIDLIVTISNYDYSLIWKIEDGNGARHYKLALSKYPEISEWELKQIILLYNYETKHSRKIAFWCDNKEVINKITQSLLKPYIYRDAKVPEKLTACTDCNQNGCLTKFVCHTSSIEDAVSIFKNGKILSAVKARGLTHTELKNEVRNAAADPEDYFDYVMCSWGNCQAGDKLIIERKQGGIPPSDFDLTQNFEPSVRFYFDYDKLCLNSGAVFDGYHPVKIKDEINLEKELFACVLPLKYKDIFDDVINDNLSSQVYFIDNNTNYIKDDLYSWNEKVYNFVCKLNSKDCVLNK